MGPPSESPEDGFAELTDKQREAVEAAVENGFFDRPQGATAEEIAKGLGVSRSVFLYHLRNAEQILLGTAPASEERKQE